MFIMVDGLDGSGKSTLIDGWAEALVQSGKKVFSLKKYWTEHHTHPSLAELEPYDVILASEPTTIWVGAAIRQELIKEGTVYSAHTIATAFSLDRHIVYQRLIVPLLGQNKLIIQDRGVSTSLCYQPLQYADLTMAKVAALEGNAFTLEHAPDHLIIVDIEPDIALARLNARTGKQDNAIFEKKDFLERARQTFLSPEYQAYFTSRGTSVHILPSQGSIDIMKRESMSLFERLCTTATTHTS